MLQRSGSTRLLSLKQEEWAIAELRDARKYQLLVLASPVAFGGWAHGAKIDVKKDGPSSWAEAADLPSSP